MALEFESLTGMLRIKWLREYLSKPQSLWYYIPNKLFLKCWRLKCLGEM